MDCVTVFNLDNQINIADQCYVADSFFTRLRGLLGKTSMPVGEGLLIKPCNIVHTMGMKMVIDVIFLSQDHEVVYIIERMEPGRLSPLIKTATCVLELPAGQALRTSLQIGHRLKLTATDEEV